MATFSDIKSDYEEFWQRGHNCWQPYFRNAQLSLKGYAGQTWTDNEIRKLMLEQRTAQEFNIIRPQINFFSGYARDNIKSTIIAPVEDSDQKTADQLSEVMKYVYTKGSGIQTMLNGFDDCLKSGMALVGMYLDYSQDPIHGDIRFYKRSFNSFIVDPDFEKPDLSDASEVILRDFVTREDAKALLPMVDPKVIDEVPAYSNDNKFNFLRNNRTFYTNRDLVSYDSYYRKTTVKRKEILNLDTGSSIPFFGDAEEEELMQEKIEFGRQMGVNAALVERSRQIVELNILLSGEVVFSGPDPLGLEDYPFVPILCHFEPQLSDFGLKIQGIAYGLLDAQRAFNKRMIRKEDVMDSVTNTGMFYKVGEVNIEDIRQTGAGRFIPVDSTLPFQEVVQQIQQGAIPQGWQEETQFIQDLTMKISGVNESLMGSDEGGNTQVSGRLAEVRASNGLRANRSIFDNFEKAQQLLGSKVLRLIQKNYGPGKIRRIINEEPTQQFFDQEFDRFDAVIKQGILSQTQRDAFYFEILRLVEIFGPDKIPASLAIKNLPMVGASDVQEAIQAQEEQAKQLQQLQEEERQRTARLQDSMTEENVALAQERRARVLSDIGLAQERQSEIRQNIAKANLDQAKTLAEIDNLQTDNLEKLLSFLQFLRSQELAEQNTDLNENFAIADRIAKSAQPPQQEANQQQQIANQQQQFAAQTQNLGGQNANI